MTFTRPASNLGLRLICLLTGPLGLLAQEVPAWQMTWSDEFDQADGSAPDARFWKYDVGGGGWGNNELQYYTNNRRENARIENHCLIIEARAEPYTVNGTTYDYTSARLTTAGLRSVRYGRVEARIRIPQGQGIWSAFWLLGSNLGSVGWPQCGEMDVMENIGSEPNAVHGAAHGPGYSGTEGKTARFTASEAFHEDFHLYALEWNSDLLIVSVDNQPYFGVAKDRLLPGETWAFDNSFSLLLNIAVGGKWPGDPDASTPFPQQMVVDYVRVYSSTTAPLPSLSILPLENDAELQWPNLFPQARVQTKTALESEWADIRASGERDGPNLTTLVTPGFFRLQL